MNPVDSEVRGAGRGHTSFTNISCLNLCYTPNLVSLSFAVSEKKNSKEFPYVHQYKTSEKNDPNGKVLAVSVEVH